eukprot:14250027-Alexandrium_andersonii.AAC.1
MMCVFSAKPLKIEQKARKLFPGTTQGNFIGPVAVPNYEDLWRVHKEDKNKLLGVRGKIAAGGAAED